MRRLGATVLAMLGVFGVAGCSADDDAIGSASVVTPAATAPPVDTIAGTSPDTSPDTITGTTPGTTGPDPTATVPDPTATSVPTTPAPGEPVTPDGFDLVRATVTTVEGEVCDLCLWVAATSRDRSRGLMGVTELGDGDGMAFVYGAPHTGSFWMKNTLLALSIAFFDDRGRYLDAFDMEPCVADPCPLYPTAPDFLVAIETEQGGLGALGIGEGSRLDLTDLPCA